MTEFSMTRRSITLLGIGVLAVFAATLFAGAVPAHAKAVGSHGYWIASQQKLNGEWVTTAQTEYGDGAIAALVISCRAGIKFRFQDKKGWDLRQGRSVPIRIYIDGDGYKGTAEAVNDSEYETRDLSVDFLKALIEGEIARAELDGSTWTLKLRGLKDTLRDAWQRSDCDRYDRYRGDRGNRGHRDDDDDDSDDSGRHQHHDR
jgi:hypothetical protein